MSKLKKNKEYISNNGNLFRINSFNANYELQYICENSKEQVPSLKICKDAINCQQIHSAYTPIKEAALLAEHFNTEKEYVLVTGIGLAYHLEALQRKYPNKIFFIVECDKQLFLHVLQYIDLEQFNNCFFFVGYLDYQLNDLFIQSASKAIQLNEIDVFEFKPYLRLHQDYYGIIIKRIKQQKIYNISDLWKYPKFTNTSLGQTKILFIDSSYVLTKECLFAIQKTGNLVHYVHIDEKQYAYEEFIRNLMKDINDFKPDFILTINHLGFDKEGHLTELLSEMEIPYASWFVDSPNVILSCFTQNISPYCSIFVWDEDYIQDVLDAGYPHVDYLPLATSTSIFKPLAIEKIYDVSFVGSSMVYATHKNMKSFVHRPDLLNLLEPVSDAFFKLKTRHVDHALQSLGYNDEIFEDIEQKEDFYAAVLWRSTQKYRLSGILKLEEFNPVISGDENWQRLLPFSFNTISERWYYDNLNDFYNQSLINFNMTSLQMKNAVNQRVFDVPATNSFLLTDYKKQLHEVFDLKEDIAVFEDVEEIPDLCKFFLANKSQTQKMAKRAMNKVLAHHTYEQRIVKMIDIMKNRYFGA